MKKAIVILSLLFLLTQGTAMAARAGRDRIDRRPMGYGNGYDCSTLTANAKLKLTAEQADRLRALDEKYGQEIEPILVQLHGKGQELKAEWLQTKPDRSRIKIMQDEAAILRERMRIKFSLHRTEVLKVLTLEQRAHVPDDGTGRVFFKHPGFGRK
jgi:Spy/CpxP family protein refolding chaperone